ncbi:HD-GYP domain-containing protein [Domibacillus robiginosus]|uniref:HD-GYP domain-containing protein n=1 Tax=Domibacillus robiginosus TaxID=1071054 RepID=UPI00067BA23E|nr:HD-GYP domain-containing protein [Domibacillus robiginosus]
MHVKIEDIKPGYQVKEAIMAATATPIIAAGTILTEQHIRFLNAFSIQSVDVIVQEEQLVLLNPSAISTRSLSGAERMEQLYFKTLNSVKAEFQRWQSGMNVEIARVRTIILPILEYILEQPQQFEKMSAYARKDEYLYHHTLAVSLLSGLMAQKLNYDKGLIVQAALAGFLAECGMSKITMSLLSKKTALTESEYKEIQNHPVVSYKMIKDLKLLKPEAKLAVYQHHERMDGSGYPAGTKGNSVHILSQLIGLADTYHALTTDRLFRARKSVFKAVEIIQQDLFGQFDLSVTEALFSLVAELSQNMQVTLSDGSTGKVIFISPVNKTRPLVQLVNGEVIDLVQRRDLCIETAEKKTAY